MAKLIDLNGLAHVYSIIKGMLADKLGKNDTAVNAAKVNNLTVETAVPKNAKFTDTVYTHPSTHPASMITGLASVATSGSYNDLSNRPTVVKTVNNTAPDENGNVTIPISGGSPSDSSVSLSAQNTWTAQQTFEVALLEQEKYVTAYDSGTSVTLTKSTARYIATGNSTLDLTTMSSLINSGQSQVITVYIQSSADYSLTIKGAGTLKYIGAASDLAITSAGLLLNILMMSDGNSGITSIVQASKLS